MHFSVGLHIIKHVCVYVCLGTFAPHDEVFETCMIIKYTKYNYIIKGHSQFALTSSSMLLYITDTHGSEVTLCSNTNTFKTASPLYEAFVMELAVHAPESSISSQTYPPHFPVFKPFCHFLLSLAQSLSFLSTKLHNSGQARQEIDLEANFPSNKHEFGLFSL